MLIGVDWDDTFTADPVLFQHLVELAVSRGHRVWIITWRDEDWPIERVPSGVERVLYCGLRAKAEVVAETGEEVDVWIDDTPFAILNGCPAALRFGSHGE